MTIHDDYSPNQSARPVGVVPSLIVVHGTVGTDAGDLSWIKNPASAVSYHYFVMRTGQIHRLVRPERKAWHAGKSVWNGRSEVNNFSIGIGLSNLGNGEPYTPAQYKAAGWLCGVLMRHYPIPSFAGIVGHHHVSGSHLKVRTDPKSDPWIWFEWGRLFDEILLAQGAPAALKAA